MRLPQRLRKRIHALKRRVSQSMSATGGYATPKARRLQRRLAKATNAARASGGRSRENEYNRDWSAQSLCSAAT
jgi:hypothetical protein